MPDEVADGDKIESETESDTLSAQPAPKPVPLHSCLFRRDSARASIKKKVRCNEAAFVIPASNFFIDDDDWHEVPHEDDDDDVFSESAPAQPRGNMCTPYVERKGSLPGSEPLPDWFPNRLLCDSNLFTSLHTLPFVSSHLRFVFIGIVYSSVRQAFMISIGFFSLLWNFPFTRVLNKKSC